MSVRKSLGIVTITRSIVFVMSFVTVIVVSRLLTPEEIGIFSVSVAAVSLGHVFRDFGVGQYLIQVREVTRQARRAAFTVTMTFSSLIAAALFFGRDYAAQFYSNEGVANVLTLLAINFLILPFGAPLRTLLTREMEFKKLAVVNLSNHVVQSGTTILTALAGASFMSMAWGSIAGNIANVVVLLFISPARAFDWPTRHGLGEVLRFGSKASVAGLATEAGQAAPDLVLGRTLGFADVAFFSRAKGLLSMALQQLMYVVRSVYTPAFAKGFREGRDPAALYTQTMSMLLGLTVPIIAVLALLAPYLISLLFGPQWARSAPLSSILCIYALITAPYALAPVSLTASGHVGAMMRCRLVTELVRILVLLSSLWCTLEVVVAALGIAYLTEALAYSRALRRTIGLRAGSLLKSASKSYVVALITVIGPCLLVGLHRTVFSLSDLMVVVLGATLAFFTWAAGIALTKHPLVSEISRLRTAVNQSLRGKH